VALVGFTAILAGLISNILNDQTPESTTVLTQPSL